MAYVIELHIGFSSRGCSVCLHITQHHPASILWVEMLNSLRPRWNRRHFANNVFKCTFLNENEWILLRISPKFVPKVQINNIPTLVQIMTWRRPGDKPLSEPMTVRLPMHICITLPQWVNWIPLDHEHMQGDGWLYVITARKKYRFAAFWPSHCLSLNISFIFERCQMHFNHVSLVWHII